MPGNTTPRSPEVRAKISATLKRRGCKGNRWTHDRVQRLRDAHAAGGFDGVQKEFPDLSRAQIYVIIRHFVRGCDAAAMKRPARPRPSVWDSTDFHVRFLEALSGHRWVGIA